MKRIHVPIATAIIYDDYGIISMKPLIYNDDGIVGADMTHFKQWRDAEIRTAQNINTYMEKLNPKQLKSFIELSPDEREALSLKHKKPKSHAERQRLSTLRKRLYQRGIEI